MKSFKLPRHHPAPCGFPGKKNNIPKSLNEVLPENQKQFRFAKASVQRVIFGSQISERNRTFQSPPGPIGYQEQIRIQQTVQTTASSHTTTEYK